VADSPESARPRASAADWLYWAAVWLAIVLAGVKAAYLGTHGELSFFTIRADIESLAAISTADVIFVVTLWFCGRALVAATGAHRWLALVVVTIFIAAAA
jgi:hypothetical protein